jgi:hypothetical protein
MANDNETFPTILKYPNTTTLTIVCEKFLATMLITNKEGHQDLQPKNFLHRQSGILLQLLMLIALYDDNHKIYKGTIVECDRPNPHLFPHFALFRRPIFDPKPSYS